MYAIADDILITGSGSDDLSAKRDHDANLLALLERCRQHGVKLNRDKLQMKRQSFVFMGHELTPNGLRPDKRKVEALSTCQRLKIRLPCNDF